MPAKVPAVCSGASSAFVAILNIMGAAFTNFKRACAEDDKDGICTGSDISAWSRFHRPMTGILLELQGIRHALKMGARFQSYGRPCRMEPLSVKQCWSS